MWFQVTQREHVALAVLVLCALHCKSCTSESHRGKPRWIRAFCHFDLQLYIMFVCPFLYWKNPKRRGFTKFWHCLPPRQRIKLAFNVHSWKADEAAVWFIELCFEIRSRRMPPLHNSSTSACHHLHQQHALKGPLWLILHASAGMTDSFPS